jgi:adenylosuccinate synthase
MAFDSQISGHAQGMNSNLARIAQVLETRFALAAFKGTFTCANATTTTVNNANVKANSVILLMGTNAAAGALEAGANKPYVSARNAGVSFVITGAGAAAGTETYEYVIVNVG